MGPFGFGSSLVGSAPVGNGPSLLAVNPTTHTIYVANGENNNGPAAGGDTVSVVDARHCNAHDVSRCKGPWPTITVGNGTIDDLPSAIAIDQRTDTVYVTNYGADTVSVFNGATCNAEHIGGCGQTPAEVPVGPGPLDIFADAANHTLYVANNDNGAVATVSMIDSETCNATDLAACPSTEPPMLSVGSSPFDFDVDQATQTAYVATLAGVSVFDASTCNATTQTGCGTLGYLTGDPNGADDAKVDQANDTLYTANYDNTISAFDLSHCYAGDLGGCATETPGTVTFPAGVPYVGFDHDLYVAVDTPLDSVYVTYQGDDALAVVDTRTCNGSDKGRCATLDPPTIHTGADPEGVVLDRSTQTLYTANEVDGDISVIDPAHCSAQTTSGCRHPAPAVAITEFGLPAVDQTVHTAYVPSGADEVSMIDTNHCNARRPGGCAAVPRQATVGQNPQAVAVDRRTHTVYVANQGSAPGSGSVSVLDARACNAADRAGCRRAETLDVPDGNPVGIAVDAATDTVYVATDTISGPNLISVFNGATCNASDRLGCTQAAAVLSVGDSGGAGIDLAIDDSTDTLYVTNNPYADPTGNAVYVFNAATCNATDTAGCGQTPATVTVGSDPAGLAVDRSTDTLYAVVHAEGDYPASVAVINGATCNGSNSSGCNQTPAMSPAGLGALGVAVDPRTQKLYVTNLQDTSVSVINGATCNSHNTSDCGHVPAEDAVGNYPFGIAVDAAIGTAYVSNLDNTVSVIPAGR
jgi:DNA-binding beta-propeller fold protein YncE